MGCDVGYEIWWFVLWLRDLVKGNFWYW